jgi:hypothetical protein
MKGSSMSNVFFEAADLFSARRAGENILQSPVPTVPGRVPSSIRRTSHIDVLRPHGISGDLLMVGGGRDLKTAESGHGAAVREGSMRLEISMPALKVRSVSAGGIEGKVQDLAGANVFGGFRRNLAAVAAGSDQGSVGLSLLDDVPVAAVIASYVPFAAGAVTAADRASFVQRLGVCQGWKEGGTVDISLAGTGSVPVHPGPQAPPLLKVPGDPLAWHIDEPPEPGSVRRLRRLDVWLDGDVIVDGMFRDTHSDTHGRERVIHEYRLRARVDPVSLRILAITAEPRVLPYQECPSVAQSAERLIGESLTGLRRRVAVEFSGVSTCTHLNDMLRSLGDVPYLLELLRS